MWALRQAPAAQHPPPRLGGAGESRGDPQFPICRVSHPVGSLAWWLVNLALWSPGASGFSRLLASNPRAGCGTISGQTCSAAARGQVEGRTSPSACSSWPRAPHAQACGAQPQVGGSGAEPWASDMLPSGRSQLVLCTLPCLVPEESSPSALLPPLPAVLLPHSLPLQPSVSPGVPSPQVLVAMKPQLSSLRGLQVTRSPSWGWGLCLGCHSFGYSLFPTQPGCTSALFLGVILQGDEPPAPTCPCWVATQDQGTAGEERQERREERTHVSDHTGGYHAVRRVLRGVPSPGDSC